MRAIFFLYPFFVRCSRTMADHSPAKRKCTQLGPNVESKPQLESKPKVKPKAEPKAATDLPEYSYTVSCYFTTDNYSGETRIVRFYNKTNAVRFAHEQAVYCVNLDKMYCETVPKIPFNPKGEYNNHDDEYYHQCDISIATRPMQLIEGEILLDEDAPRSFGMHSYKDEFPKDSVTWGIVYPPKLGTGNFHKTF